MVGMAQLNQKLLISLWSFKKKIRVVRNYDKDNNNRYTDKNNSNDDQLVKESFITVRSITLIKALMTRVTN